MTMADARTRSGSDVHLVGVIGSPVAHSLSPLLHDAAFAAMGLGEVWRSFAFEIPGGAAAAALDAMRSAAVTGLSVTMPHKGDVARLVDESSETARRLGAVNCVLARPDGSLFGTNTDGEGFVASLARGSGFTPQGRRCVVVGAGGAARAVILALADAGAAHVARPVGEPVPSGGSELDAAVQAADLVVNATPLGMVGTTTGGREEWLVRPEILRGGQVAADLVYAPRPTPWLVAARAAGATTLDGLGMLVHQAAAQLALWTGREPPVEAMWEAAERSSPPSG